MKDQLPDSYWSTNLCRRYNLLGCLYLDNFDQSHFYTFLIKAFSLIVCEIEGIINIIFIREWLILNIHKSLISSKKANFLNAD